MTFSMICSYKTSDLSADCSFGFSAGGGMGYNFDIELNNPTFSGSIPDDTIIVPPPVGASTGDIDPTLYKTIFTDPSTGITVQAIGALSIGATGTGYATGTASIKSSFDTTANMVVGGGTSVSFVEGFDQTLSIVSPTFSTNLVLKAATMTVTLKPTVYWRIGLLEGVPSTGAVSMFVDLITPLLPSNAFTYSASVAANKQIQENIRMDSLAASAASCSNTMSLPLSTNVTGITVAATIPVLGTYKMTAPMDVSSGTIQVVIPVTSTSAAYCMAAADNVPAPGPAPAPSSSSGSSIFSNGTVLSDSNLAMVIILPIVFVIFLAMCVVLYMKFTTKASLTNTEMTSTTKSVSI
jgi:hypothetical protein